MKRIIVRRSNIHGRGLFATRPIEEGEHIVEYLGERISWPEATGRAPRDPENPCHTFFFGLSDGSVIDGAVGGNSSRWINHSCKPNATAEESEGRVYISALSNIAPGEEIRIDYALTLEERQTAALRANYACRCGAANCRNTMLAPRPRRSAGKGSVIA